MDHAEVRKLHHEVDFVGLRAQATSVGFIQLARNCAGPVCSTKRR